MPRRSSWYLLTLIILMFLLPGTILLLSSKLPPSLDPAVPVAVGVLGIVTGAYLLVRLQAAVRRERQRN